MSTYERDKLNVNGDTVNLRDAGSVRFDRAQSLTAAQQAQARDNIGAGTGTGDVTGVKGSAENDYRTGQVNLTPADIGAVSKSGDTMTGPLKWGSSSALSASSSLQYFLGIDAFADGGTTHYITAANAVQNLFYTGPNAITAYPTKPGIYRTTLNASAGVFAHMQPDSLFGVLVIFRAEYGMHLYLCNGHLYFGYSGNTFGEPATWYDLSTTAMPVPQT